MTVTQAIESRRSIRKYKPDSIEDDKLKQIGEAFRLAPSARNGQSWKLLIVTDPVVKERVAQAHPPGASPAGMILEAPAVLVGICSTQNVMSNGHRVDSIDVSIAMTFAMLKAEELGLGTVWMAYYDEPKMRNALGLGEDKSIVAIMPVGYANEAPEARPRKAFEEVVEIV